MEIGEGGLNSDNPVDGVGYPGQYSKRDVWNIYPSLIDRDIVNDVSELFPQSRLVVTWLCTIRLLVSQRCLDWAGRFQGTCTQMFRGVRAS